MSLHEYVDSRGVRTRYIHITDPEEFKRTRDMYVNRDKTTLAMRRIEDAEDLLKFWSHIRMVLSVVLFVSLVGVILAFWPLLPSAGLAKLVGFLGILTIMITCAGVAGSTVECRDSRIKLRNHHRELEDIMMVEV